jgi:hypothetical protein
MCSYRPPSNWIEELPCVNIHSLLQYIDEKSSAYTHIVDGRIYPAKIRRRRCDTQMIIFIPIEGEFVGLKALVVVRNPHSHPAHPRAKPNAQDRMMLGTAVESAGLTGLTVKKLLNGQYLLCCGFP